MQLRHSDTGRISGALLVSLLAAAGTLVPGPTRAAQAAPAYRKADNSGMPPGALAALKKYLVPAPPATLKVGDHPRVVLRTTKGPITLELDTKAAPLHVRSFVYLVRRGFYNGTEFHRREDLTGSGGNIVQGGDPLSKDAANSQFFGVGGPGYQVPLEISSLKHDTLVIAMARSKKLDSAGSQFYLTQGPVHFLDGKYTVFGKVVGGPNAALSLRKGDRLESATVVGSQPGSAPKAAAKKVLKKKK